MIPSRSPDLPRSLLRSRSPNGALFFVLLIVSLSLYGFNRWSGSRLCYYPSGLLLAPLTLLQEITETRARLRNENTLLAQRCLQLEQEALALRNELCSSVDSTSQSVSRVARVPLIRALVVARDFPGRQSLLTIDRGLFDGVRRNAPAFAQAAVCGKVIEVGPTTSFVATLTHPQGRVASLDKRTGVTGVTKVTEGNELLLDYLPLDADVALGDTIVTTDIGGVFPAGVPVGVVSRIDSLSGGIFKPVFVRPIVRLEAIDAVYLPIRH